MSILNKISAFKSTPRMPLLFLGHGSPMNAIEENEFVRGFREVAASVPLPAAILCISAHWETRGTHVTINEHPRTIHDFGGFPPELYQVKYPAPGSQPLAGEIANIVKSEDIVPDQSWGLDHGAWSVIKHMYPDADVPVVQLSLNYLAKPDKHYSLAEELKELRDHGILIIGSGNIVHNLSLVDWRRLNDTYAFDWATEVNSKIKQLLANGDHRELMSLPEKGGAYNLAIPTPEHYLPLLYIAALQRNGENVTFFNDKPLAGSLTMTSVKIG
jgi:4,5-DOPA dioxygenase extradiol